MRLVNPRERFNPFFFPCAGKKKALRGKRKGRPRGISNFPLGNPLKATKKGACAPPVLDLPPELHYRTTIMLSFVRMYGPMPTSAQW